VNGLEQLKWSPKGYDQVTYDVQIPFIRQFAGPMDYTQGAMRNAIKKNYNPESYVPNDIEFNKNFLKKYYKQSGVLGKELFDNYEPFIQINGKMAKIDDELKTGDLMEVLLGKSLNVNKNWLDIVKTTWARDHIKKMVKIDEQNKN
jgi:hypothetical protein